MYRAAFGILGLLLAVMLGPVDKAWSQPVVDFYKGKSVTLTVGAAAGGGYDIAARMVSRHIGRHIPGGPAIVVKNMPGANSLPMTNFLYNVAAKDGTELGAPNNGIPFEPLLHVLSKDGSNVKFDPLRFNWIGSPIQEVYVLLAWHTTPYKTFKDLIGNRMLVGSMGANADNSILPSILEQLTGAQFKIIHGYQGQNDLLLAIERGELAGAGGIGYNGLVASRPDWLRDRKINLLVQFGAERHPDMPNVPTAADLVTASDDRAVLDMLFAKYRLSRPLVAPPDVPQERVAALRRAFDDTMKDEKLLQEAQTMGMEISPTSGAEIEAVIRKVHQSDPNQIAKARKLVTPVQ